MLTLRTAGLRAAQVFPALRPLLRSVYRALPSVWHDNPTTWLRRIFRKQGAVAFVQIGAFDGVADDYLRPLLFESDKWHGVLIEPQTEIFEKLKLNYAALASRLQFLNCAISRTAGHLTLHTVPESEIERLKLDDWVRELATADAAHITKRLPNVRVLSTEVNAITFDDALAKTGLSTVDCVLMDTEGHEHKIIPSIDFDRYGVKAIVYEYAHLTPDQDSEIRALLVQKGFRMHEFGYDVLAWRGSTNAPHSSARTW